MSLSKAVCRRLKTNLPIKIFSDHFLNDENVLAADGMGKYEAVATFETICLKMKKQLLVMKYVTCFFIPIPMVVDGLL